MHRAMARAVIVVLCCSGLTARACERVIVVADLHGGYGALLEILTDAKLVGEDLEWLDDDDCLVQLGDVVDRGADSRRALDLLMELQEAHPNQVHVLLGDHEVMSLVGDLRDALPSEFAAYAADETEEQRRVARVEYLALIGRRSESEDPDAMFEAAFPPGWFGHRKAFSSEGRYGRWLVARPFVLVLGRSLFVHGGLGTADALLGVDELNHRMKRALTEHLRLRSALVASEELDPLLPFPEDVETVAAGLDDTDEPSDARRFVELNRTSLFGDDGPLWNRDLAVEEEASHRGEVDAMLDALGVDRIVVGHTPQEDHRVHVRFDGGVILADTGIGPAHGGQASAVEILNDRVYALYPDRLPELIDTGPSDEEIERELLEGNVVSMKPIGSGITGSMKVRLELDGRERTAAFKTLDQQHSGVTRFKSDEPQWNFRDSYRSEIAAYRVDRLLGLGLVPVTVSRRIKGTPGALIDWVHRAMTEGDRIKQGRPLPARAAVDRVKMDLFDALIGNVDRHAGNQMVTPTDGRLHLIDHSRSFQVLRELPERYLEVPTAQLPRDVYDRLSALDERSLQEALKGLVEKSRLHSLLERRDLILQKIDRDRQELGDERVFGSERAEQ